MKINNYILRARFFPAIINTIPFMIIGLTITDQHLKGFFQELIGIKLISEISLSLVLIYATAQLQRIFSKELFENRIFNKGLNFPTSQYLLYDDKNYSFDYKQKIRNKIYEDFDIELPTKLEEQENNILARKKIAEAVSLIRRKVGEGTLTLQHNIEYGFIRNLVGGSILGFVGSLTIIVLYKFKIVNVEAYITSWILICIYLVILLMSSILIKRYAKLYANMLFQDFLTLK